MNETYCGHKFDPQVAELYKLPAALIYQYIVWYNAHQTKLVPLSARQLAELYPYLSDGQTKRGLRRLINPGRKTPALVHRQPSSEGRCYLYAPAFTVKYSDVVTHKFNARLAEKVGVVPAIIYQSVRGWIIHNWREKAETLYTHLDPEKFDYSDLEMQRFAYQHTRRGAAHYTTVAKWQKYHKYVSRMAAHRGFIRLQKVGLLIKKPGRYRIHFWHLPEPELTKYRNDMLSKNDLEIHNPKTTRQIPKRPDRSQNDPTDPKTTQTFPVTHSESGTNHGVVLAGCTSMARDACVEKQVKEDSDAFRSDSLLASARCESAGTASNASSASPAVSTTKCRQSVIEKLDCWNVPSVKKKILKDSFGFPAKRKYVRRPGLEDPELDDYLDDLTPEDRIAYVKSLQEKRISPGQSRGSLQEGS